jgi:hypothetical protein
MQNLCDTCGRAAETFRLQGRTDSNCAECSTNIAMLVLLFHKLRISEGDGGNTQALEAEIASTLHRLVEPSRYKAFENTLPQLWIEISQQLRHVN